MLGNLYKGRIPYLANLESTDCKAAAETPQIYYFPDTTDQVATLSARATAATNPFYFAVTDISLIATNAGQYTLFFGPVTGPTVGSARIIWRGTLAAGGGVIKSFVTPPVGPAYYIPFLLQGTGTAGLVECYLHGLYID